MVFFNCNACGEALKKNQVDKHCQRCRNCEALSCVDCGKDFWGDDYKYHTKCMTEDEKYCGKGYVPKVNKGEAKQEEWIEKVQTAILKASKNPQMSQLLENLKEYPNIPRKRAKFENFLRNSLRIHNNFLINEVWDLLMAAANQTKVETIPKDDSQQKSSAQNGEVKENENGFDQEPEEENTHMSKREKKEERRKKAHKKEKKDKPSTEEVDDTSKPVKGKKRKREAEATDETHKDGADPFEDLSKKKKKKKRKLSECQDLNGNAVTDAKETADNDTLVEETEMPSIKRKKSKFNWEDIIIAVLKSKGEMSLKKLRKKVLNEFAAQDAANYNEENLSAKFMKKIRKISGVTVSKERVNLKIK